MVHELDISQIIDSVDTSLWRVGGAYFKASIESEGGWDRSVGLSCVPTWISRISVIVVLSETSRQWFS